jgi:asparagine synthase (glutamine-hydrolysing)
MCGISGIINKSGAVVNKEDIQLMNNLISHRGPDGEGFYICNSFAFGHRRLAILDLTSDGAQPMHWNNRLTIIYNGEIYNYLELKKELEEDGYSFRSRTDTEVVLAAYDKWGKKCVERFNGMWSFAIWDRISNIIFCSRDRFGVKPFYFFDNREKFVFGSEIKQCLMFMDRILADKDSVIDFVVTRFADHTENTFFKGVKKLPPGNSLVYDLNSHSYCIEDYYHPDRKEEANKSKCTEFDELLYDSVALRLRSDVRVGTCLSGGLDSSTIAAIASMKYDSQQKFVAIHAKSTEKASDESHYARMVANNCSLDLNIIEPSYADFVSSVEEVVFCQEEPFPGPSIFMQFFVMKKSKSMDCKVLLDGQGGDEILLGYEKYFPAVMISIFREKGLFRFFRSILDAHKVNSKMSLKWLLYYFLGSICSSLRQAFLWRESSFVRKEFRKRFSFLDLLARSYNDVFELQWTEISKTNLPILLRHEDKNSMWHSIEARLPFLDYRIVEKALGIHCEKKIYKGWTKHLLRKLSEKILPAEIAWRKSKLGFNSPDSNWLIPFSPFMKEQIKKSAILSEICDMQDLIGKFDCLV